ncbi:CDP-glycerol glycerophosphotransferase family protein [Pantoea sp. EA-12]|uniref:CDP-glycerol glycerophosphotransferase family protein n=1 Tax=Pantoea sp. EA-12 TaxID=3043303 RepID=UPI0024B62DA3|nr:CDP-glycerol glycerophosphotransferase family protein [Pantoea sp. EA-12]MDI9221128.1 CDP-glycerol glycerophosphotransferase family protein [Pantoea sp. EA-12]
MDNIPSIAFIGWNPFQFIHIKHLASKIDNCTFVIEKKKNYINEFDKEFFDNDSTPVMIWEQSKMQDLDGIFDIIICQTPFFRIETFKKTKIVMIQYGYAKEPHNYGPWRSLADLCLAYGDYAREKIEDYCPCVATGNPRFDQWANYQFVTNAEKTEDIKKTILYVPTWGELSSLDLYIERIISLSEKYNLILKLHHNSDLIEKKKSLLDGNENISIYGANDDVLELINKSDLVISDYSGAIFDAVYFNKPIVLLDIPLNDKLGLGKIDFHSLEFAKRSQFGLCVKQPSDLIEIVEHALSKSEELVKNYSEMRNELFTDTQNACGNIISSLNSFWKEKKEITQKHLYIRKMNQELLATKRNLNIALNKIKRLES